MTYQIATRSQRARRGRGGFSGPDQYMAVLSIPDGAQVPGCLNQRVLAMRGIGIHYTGQFYSRHMGPRSAYARCWANARQYIAAQQEAAR